MNNKSAMKKKDNRVESIGQSAAVQKGKDAAKLLLVWSFCLPRTAHTSDPTSSYPWVHLSLHRALRRITSNISVPSAREAHRYLLVQINTLA
mmetsp:Transcript_6025/g.7846  ORF Transcript_6025/g.7846 Transcript_6025/m.7846 type:complete len:92 (+) Transcript_6025:147-422(+)